MRLLTLNTGAPCPRPGNPGKRTEVRRRLRIHRCSAGVARGADPARPRGSPRGERVGPLPEKTRIVDVNRGFDFLGCNVQEHHCKLLMRPAKKKVLAFVQKVRKLIGSQVWAPTAGLLARLNVLLRGWGDYYRNIVASATFVSA